MARVFSTSVAQKLTFWRGTSESINVEIHRPNGPGEDVYLVMNDNTSYFFRREQARRFARALLEAAEE